MTEQKRVGAVTSVTSGKLTAVLDPEVKSLSLELNGRVYYVGQIGSYVLIPVGKLIIVSMVSEFKKIDFSENGKLSQRCVMDLDLVGTVKAGRYERGVSVVPPVDSPVFIAEDADLTAVFSVFRKYGFSVGQLSLFERERAYLDPNRFFGKHLAILGSSGSGKSCTVSSILQKVATYPDTNVIILDIHNEYSSAFPDSSKRLDIAELELPYWLMNLAELEEMFIDPRDENAASQVSVLKDLVVASKKGKNPQLSDIITVDTPVYFDLSEVRAKIQYLDTEKISGLGTAPKEGPFYGKFARFLVRLDSRLNDPRYSFMFKPREYVQSSSFKDLLNMMFGGDQTEQITIMDLSGVPFDIVNTIVSLLGRLAFDFNFWNANRRDFPILLVFEEAHNYLPSGQAGSGAARRTVERIAKEGRKYGVSCLIVSQRPAEVSETILAQCNNFVILRLTNPVDQNYVRKVMSDTFAGLVDTLPALRQGEALIVGEAIPMPLRVQIDYPNPEPSSADIKFFDKWKQSDVKTDIPEVVERWWKQQRG
ncbi:MAG: ATP-binding protein [Ignavibacteria bacterium]|nr:ATP-binding protein [Ignavibacteria bacterium]